MPVLPPEKINSDRNQSWTVVDPSTTEHWDELVLSHPQGHFFHGNAWCRVLSKTYGFKPYYLFRKNDNVLTEMWPLMETKSLLQGKRGIGLPFTDICEPLVSAPKQGDPKPELFDKALELAANRKWTSIQWRGGDAFTKQAISATRFAVHSAPLCDSESRLWKNIHASHRRAIKKAKLADIRVECGHQDTMLAKYYDLHCLTRRKHGTPPQPWRFFYEINQEILKKGLGNIWTAFKQNRAVASAVFFHLGRKVFYKFGASDPKELADRPNNLLMWEALKYYGQASFQSMHFGRTSLHQEGLRRFKKGWGGVESIQSYWEYNLKKGRFVTHQDPANGPQTKFLQMMPLWLLRQVGRFAYHHLIR